jgi:hypothetical protein
MKTASFTIPREGPRPSAAAIDEIAGKFARSLAVSILEGF